MTSSSNLKVLESAREKLALNDTSLFEGIRIYNFPGFNSDIQDVLYKISKLPLRPSDVLSCGYMRSGNNWLFETLTLIMTQSTQYAKEMMPEHFLEFEKRNSNLHEHLGALPEPRLLASHLQPKFLPRAILQTPVKIVYILRNPKDAIVSWYRRTSSYKSEEARFRGSWEEFFELQLSGEFVRGSWFDHVLSWEKFFQDHPSLPVYVVQYETLKEQPIDVIRELCRFLGQPENMAEQIAEATTFDNLKHGIKDKLAKNDSDVLLDGCNNGLLDRGLVQGWRTSFTVDQSDRFNQIFEEKMAGSKLGKLVRPYI